MAGDGCGSAAVRPSKSCIFCRPIPWSTRRVLKPTSSTPPGEYLNSRDRPSVAQVA